MGLPDPSGSSASETHAEMMQATYDALQKHGYSDLTIQRIGDEFPKSKSLIYQHYDGKDELLTDFLSFLLSHFESEFQRDGDLTPQEHLQELLDLTLPPSLDDDQAAFTRAIMALRGQAPYDEAFRDRFTETDPVFRSHVVSILRDGVDDGTFRDVNPEEVAEYIVTTIQGTMFRRATTEDAIDVTAVRRELDEYLRVRLGLELDS